MGLVPFRLIFWCIKTDDDNDNDARRVRVQCECQCRSLRVQCEGNASAMRVQCHSSGIRVSHCQCIASAMRARRECIAGAIPLYSKRNAIAICLCRLDKWWKVNAEKGLLFIFVQCRL